MLPEPQCREAPAADRQVLGSISAAPACAARSRSCRSALGGLHTRLVLRLQGALATAATGAAATGAAPSPSRAPSSSSLCSRPSRCGLLQLLARGRVQPPARHTPGSALATSQQGAIVKFAVQLQCCWPVAACDCLRGTPHALPWLPASRAPSSSSLSSRRNGAHCSCFDLQRREHACIARMAPAHASCCRQ